MYTEYISMETAELQYESDIISVSVENSLEGLLFTESILGCASNYEYSLESMHKFKKALRKILELLVEAMKKIFEAIKLMIKNIQVWCSSQYARRQTAFYEKYKDRIPDLYEKHKNEAIESPNRLVVDFIDLGDFFSELYDSIRDDVVDVTNRVTRGLVDGNVASEVHDKMFSKRNYDKKLKEYKLNIDQLRRSKPFVIKTLFKAIPESKFEYISKEVSSIFVGSVTENEGPIGSFVRSQFKRILYRNVKYEVKQRKISDVYDVDSFKNLDKDHLDRMIEFNKSLNYNTKNIKRTIDLVNKIVSKEMDFKDGKVVEDVLSACRDLFSIISMSSFELFNQFVKYRKQLVYTVREMMDMES